MTKPQHRSSQGATVLVAGLLVCGITAVLAVGTRASASDATTPGKNGQIAFVRYRLQDAPLWSEIYVVNADGSGARKVSRSPVAVQDGGPQWSPDGRLIVFERCRGGHCSVWLVRPDGSGQRRLTPACDRPAPACADYSHASFAPDGRHVVLQRWKESLQASDIVSVDLRGKETVILKRAPGLSGLSSPQISPNGRLLLFKGVNAADHQALFVRPLSGGSSKRVTPWRMEVAGGDWSPDGTRILFQSRSRSGEVLVPGTAMYQVRADGTELDKVSNVPPTSYVIAGSYSPDGRWIVYGAGFDVTLASGVKISRDLVKQRVGGSEVVPVLRSAQLDGWPAWGSATP